MELTASPLSCRTTRMGQVPSGASVVDWAMRGFKTVWRWNSTLTKRVVRTWLPTEPQEPTIQRVRSICSLATRLP